MVIGALALRALMGTPVGPPALPGTEESVVMGEVSQPPWAGSPATGRPDPLAGVAVILTSSEEAAARVQTQLASQAGDGGSPVLESLPGIIVVWGIRTDAEWIVRAVAEVNHTRGAMGRSDLQIIDLRDR
jgi:hypothetical protein